MPDYIQKRHRTWYAVLEIPKDLRAALSRPRFVRSLKTEDRSEAINRARPYVSAWKLKIAKARADGQAMDPMEREALFWREAIAKERDPEQKEILGLLLTDKAEEWERKDGYKKAKRLYDIADDKTKRTDEHLEDWLLTVNNVTPKTKDLKRQEVQQMTRQFRYLSDLSDTAVQQWIHSLVVHDGKAKNTVQRLVGSCRQYLSYLRSTGSLPKNVRPFEGPDFRVPTSTNNTEKAAFTVEEVRKLLEAVSRQTNRERGAVLADLITLGMWTGARIEELCRLRVEDVNLEQGYFEVRQGKTKAARRQVPIHSKLKPTLERLVADSEDGFVIARQTENNKYRQRSSALGKRFGRLKKDLGMGSDKSFHSWRHTVTTILRNKGAPEQMVASVVGHEGGGFTFSTYGKDLWLETIRPVIE